MICLAIIDQKTVQENKKINSKNYVLLQQEKKGKFIALHEKMQNSS